MTAAPRLSLRLRAETRTEHAATEAALDWERRVASPAAYRHWLKRLWSFHRAWEPAVAATIGPAAFAPHGRLAAIGQDLHTLGATPAEIAALPPFPRPIAFAGAAAGMGSLYVIEGSMLGGQLIARRVEAAFGFRPAYHGGYAGGDWRTFRDALDALPTDGHDEATAAARDTFVLLRDWLAAEQPVGDHA